MVNNPQAIAAFERAARWVGAISPPAVVQHAEQDCLPVWGAGLAVLVRLFPSQIYIDQFSPVPAVSREVMGQTGVTILPRAEGRAQPPWVVWLRRLSTLPAILKSP